MSLFWQPLYSLETSVSVKTVTTAVTMKIHHCDDKVVRPAVIVFTGTVNIMTVGIKTLSPQWYSRGEREWVAYLISRGSAAKLTDQPVLRLARTLVVRILETTSCLPVWYQISEWFSIEKPRYLSPFLGFNSVETRLPIGRTISLANG